MRTVNEEQFKSIISKDLSEGIYFVFGNEAYLKKHYCSQIINRFDDGTGFNLQKFNGSSDVQDIYNAVCQLPFMSERKCVSVCDLKIEELTDSSLNILHEALDSVGQHCVLLIWFNTDDITVTKEKIKKLAEHIEANGGIICRLDKKSPAEISRILCNGAAKRGCRLDPAAARYLIEQCSDDLTNLVTELDKLCSYVGKGGVISNKDIDSVCIRTIDVKAYQLGSALISGKTSEAMNLLDDLLYINLATELIFGAVASPFTDIIRLRIRKDRSLGDVAADFAYGNRDFVLKNALSVSNKLDDKRLDLCIKALNDCDAAIKSSSADPRIALEQVVVTLCGIISGRYYS